MKKILFGMMVLSTTFYACGPTHVIVSNDYPEQQPAPAYNQPYQEVTYQSFYDELSPYGTWIDYPGYGYVWMPNAEPGFKPYSSDGHWVYTQEGWTWASDYNWGWAPFHYGRWFYEGGYGWMWKPGYEWAPAWVSWRQNSDYYGWAPLGPNYSVGMSVSNYDPPSNYWSFVPNRYVNNQHINNYYVNETKNVTIINNTTIINNNVTNNNITNNNINNTNITNNNVTNNRTSNRIVYSNGPDPRQVETVTGTPVRPIAIRETSRPGVTQTTNGQLAIYRPRVNAAVSPGTNNNNASAPTIAPARVVPLRDVRPAANNGPAPSNIQAQPRTNVAPANSQAGKPNANQPARPVNSFQQPAPNPSNNNNINPNQQARPANTFQQPAPNPSNTNNINPNQPARPVNGFQQPAPNSNQPVRPAPNYQQQPNQPISTGLNSNPNPNPQARFNRFQQPPVNANPNQGFKQPNELQPPGRNNNPPIQNNQNQPGRPVQNANNNRSNQPQPQIMRVRPAPAKPVTPNTPPPDRKP